MVAAASHSAGWRRRQCRSTVSGSCVASLLCLQGATPTGCATSPRGGGRMSRKPVGGLLAQAASQREFSTAVRQGSGQAWRQQPQAVTSCRVGQASNMHAVATAARCDSKDCVVRASASVGTWHTSEQASGCAARHMHNLHAAPVLGSRGVGVGAAPRRAAGTQWGPQLIRTAKTNVQLMAAWRPRSHSRFKGIRPWRRGLGAVRRAGGARGGARGRARVMAQRFSSC